MPVHFDAQHPAIREYYVRRKDIEKQGATKETSIRDAFATLLQVTGKANGMTLVLEHRVGGMKKVLLPDGTLNDIETRYPRGYWEAKDARDVLEVEIQKKRDRGYPTSNTIFEDSKRAILYQHHKPVGEYRLDEPTELALLLNTFYSYTEPAFDTFKQAIERFKEDTPQLAAGLHARISQSHKDNSAFKQAFDTFMEQCRRDLNPKITREQVDDMLIQHLMTERLIRSLFQSDFAKRNIIAAEVEKVITALTSRSFDPKEYLGPLEYFYSAVESAAKNLANFAEKQTFLNDVYEQFFQKYSYKTADTHGIVYTPQPIVEFMVALVEDALHREFGYGLDHPHVCLIDPCTGTGNFIVQLLRRMALRSYDPNELRRFYQDRLFANEIMLLPYYLASLNIERTYYELTHGEVLPFEGLCFVDTLDLAEKRQKELLMISEKNAERVERQQRAPITVIIGNPPYNVGQSDENDNNKNRTHRDVEDRLRATYVKDSRATLRRQLYDPYVKFFRWASDRLQGRDGIVCFVTNNSFADQVAFDGMRKHLLQDFTHVYHLDLHGNVRQNPKLSGTTHNVFGIQVGVGITLAVRSPRMEGRGLHYHRVPEMWTAIKKLEFLTTQTFSQIGETLKAIPQQILVPDAKYTWLVADNADEYTSFLPMGSKEAKGQKVGEVQTIFKLFSTGIMSGRDTLVYNSDYAALEQDIKKFGDLYDMEVFRFKRKGQGQSIDDFVNYDSIKWSRNLKRKLEQGVMLDFNTKHIVPALYRPFTKKYLYFASTAIDELGRFKLIFPNANSTQDNRVIGLSGRGHDRFTVFMTNLVVDYKCPNNGNGGNQFFPFYTYDEDGSHRRENITDWALKQFQDCYSDPTITKWDIFYYVYAALHSPAYRETFAANLKRDLPRIPYQADFRRYAEAGKRLAELHVGYERVEPYGLKKNYTSPPAPLPKRGETSGKKMQMSKDKTSIRINDALTLTGIPAEAHDYVLGSRSALAWIVDQYPAPTQDTAPIVDLIGKVTAVSMATVEIVKGL